MTDHSAGPYDSLQQVNPDKYPNHRAVNRIWTNAVLGPFELAYLFHQKELFHRSSSDSNQPTLLLERMHTQE